MRSKRSRVHPPYKTKYRVSNWSSYDEALTSRGSVTGCMSLSAPEAWNAKPLGKRGGQSKYSDLAIETALTLRLPYHHPFRQTEGSLRSIFEISSLHLKVPDHTTQSRRPRTLDVQLKCPMISGRVVLAIDSSGLTIVSQGQRAAAKHGKPGISGWRKRCDITRQPSRPALHWPRTIRSQ